MCACRRQADADYEDSELLGQGAYGMVHKVQDKAVPLPFAAAKRGSRKAPCLGGYSGFISLARFEPAA